MSKPRMAVLLLVACALQACAFFGKSEPFEPRFYTPEQPASGTAQPVSTQGSGRALRLGRVVASSHLRERIAYRSSARELGFYDGKRWTERPETYLRRAVSTALFEQAGVAHVVSGPAPTLELELLEFTELRTPKREARVRVRALLSDGRTAFFERTFVATQPVRGDEDEFDGVVDALALALDGCVRELTEATLAALPAAPAPVADTVGTDGTAVQPANGELQSHRP